MKADRIETIQRPALLPRRKAWWCVAALVAAMGAAGAGGIQGHAQPPATAAASATPGHPAQAVAAGQPAKLGKTSGIMEQRREQIDDECADLLKMATTLKAEVDKTTKDELSLAVVRQADRIEKLARTVKDTMQPVVKKH